MCNRYFAPKYVYATPTNVLERIRHQNTFQNRVRAIIMYDDDVTNAGGRTTEIAATASNVTLGAIYESPGTYAVLMSFAHDVAVVGREIRRTDVARRSVSKARSWLRW